MAAHDQVKLWRWLIVSSPAGHPSPQGDIDLKPNPVYGVSGLQESKLGYYYAWDHIHKTSGDINDTYEYVN